MIPDLKTLIAKALLSVRDPRGAARWVMAFDMPRIARWQALLLVVVVSAILARLTVTFFAEPETVAMGGLLLNPATTAVIQMSVLVIAVFAIYWIGHAMGGKGGFGDTILLVAWLQFCMVCLQIAQTAALLILPPMASLIGVAGFVLFFWLLTSFVAELHGFASLAQVFLMIMVSLLALVFGMSVILTLIGITIPGAPVDV